MYIMRASDGNSTYADSRVSVAFPICLARSETPALVLVQVQQANIQHGRFCCENVE